MRKPQIMGIPYDPIIEPEKRIIDYLNSLDDLLNSPAVRDSTKEGVQAAKRLANIYFEDEIKVLNLKMQ